MDVFEINGRPADVAALGHPAVVNYGHYTALQARGGRTRGLDLHRRRLVDATRELFDADLDFDEVRAHIRHALASAGATDASVRVVVYAPDGVLVAIREPVEPPTHPLRLRSVAYQRPVAHIKHVGSFGQLYHRRRVAAAGYDEALLVDHDGAISETGIANIGFLDGGDIVWPDALMLTGTTMGLLDNALGPRPHRRVTLSDVDGYAGAFVANSHGIAAVASIDDRELPPVDVTAIVATYEATGWDAL